MRVLCNFMVGSLEELNVVYIRHKNTSWLYAFYMDLKQYQGSSNKSILDIWELGFICGCFCSVRGDGKATPQNSLVL